MFIALIGSLAIAWPLASYAQQPKQPPKRIGILFQCPLPPDDILVRRLGELGWIEGQNFVFDCVSAVGRLDQVPVLVRELVSRRPDVLIVSPPQFVDALKRETTTIPIVMLGTWEPVRLGLITSLAQPQGNVTGVAWFGLLPKQMELLKEIVPKLRRVAYIVGAVDVGYAYSPLRDYEVEEENRQIAASRLGFTWQFFQVATAATAYDEIFARLAAEHFDAVYLPGLPSNYNNRTRIGQLALRHRIPAVSDDSSWAKEGFLLTYGQNSSWTKARGVDYVDKILRGAKPSDLPVEQATKVNLSINLKTAKELGLTVPPSLIARADELIE
jgi:putative tryptophan/tyrosine transport system substrate-binding protein